MSYTVLDSVRASNDDSLHARFALDTLIGFSAAQKFLPSRYFYDDRGSELFARITELDEYYPTDCEFDILANHGETIAAMFGDRAFDVVELGAGDGRKTKVLLDHLSGVSPAFRYIPVDISEAAVAELVTSLQTSHAGVNTHGIVGDYFDAIGHLRADTSRARLVLFLGSNIGNFDFLEAMRFLRTIWKHLNHGDYMLVGFDLKKDISILMSAYNDSRGVTRDFNLNVLERMNRELGGEFDTSAFHHYGFYNPLRGAMESCLISSYDQDVYIGELRKTFHFDAYESIHLEYSYKYLLSDVADMANKAGFDVIDHWQDSRGWFVDSLWQVRKE